MKRYRQFRCSPILVVIAIITGLLLTACGSGQKIYTIGVVNIVPALDSTLVGFKEGMTELGYIEGENVTYIYEGATVDMSKLDSVVQGLVAEDVDLILSVTTPATQAAQRATAGTDIPVLFVTGMGRDSVSDEIKNLGYPILYKPFEVQDLLNALSVLFKLDPEG